MTYLQRRLSAPGRRRTPRRARRPPPRDRLPRRSTPCGDRPTAGMWLGVTAAVGTRGARADSERQEARCHSSPYVQHGRAPSWASVTLSPATLSGAATTSTITVETDGSDPDVAPADVTLTVTAAAGELSDSAELTLRVGLLKVRGKVTGTLGTPADTSGVVVSVN